MVGIPRSKRCTLCRIRKVKCDENWPTCGGCKKTGHECSGPGTLMKFVVNGNHSVPAERAETKPAGPSNHASFQLWDRHCSDKKRTKAKTPDGNPEFVVQIMRLTSSNDIPTSVAKTPSELTAAELVSCLESSAVASNQLRLAASWLYLVPRRMSNSKPLEYAIAAFMSSWTNSHKAAPIHEIIDLKAYGRALHSLRGSLLEGNRELDSSMLAAASILQRIESFWRPGGTSNHTVHSNGLSAMMKQIGPPKMNDELYVHLAFWNAPSLLTHFIATGNSYTCLRSDWIGGLQETARQTSEAKGVEQFSLPIIMAMHWPRIARALQQLHETHDPIAAAQIMERVQEVVNTLHDSDPMPSMLERGYGVELEDPGFLFGTCYNFSARHLVGWIYSHALIGIGFLRMLLRAMSFLGLADTNVHGRIRAICERTWRLYPYVRNHRPFGSGGFLLLLTLTYEFASRRERRFIVGALKDVYDGPDDGDEKWSEDIILDKIRLMTGGQVQGDREVASMLLRSDGARCCPMNLVQFHR